MADESTDLVVKHYDAVAADYDRRWRAYIDATIQAIAVADSFRNNERLIDVPCGTGALADWLSHAHPTIHVVGVDASVPMLERAKAKHAGHPYEWVAADVHDLPFDDESFDHVVCANSFHCFDRPLRVLEEFARVLRPGGRLTLLDWCDDYLLCKLCGVWFSRFDPAFRRMFTSKECRRLLVDSGFVVEAERRFRHRVLWGLMLFETTKSVSVRAGDSV